MRTPICLSVLSVSSYPLSYDKNVLIRSQISPERPSPCQTLTILYGNAPVMMLRLWLLAEIGTGPMKKARGEGERQPVGRGLGEANARCGVGPVWALAVKQVPKSQHERLRSQPQILQPRWCLTRCSAVYTAPPAAPRAVL